MTATQPERLWTPILMNRSAGPRSRESQVAPLIDILRAHGLDPELFADRQEFQQAIENPQKRLSCRCLVAAGGDGTVGWLVNTQRSLPVAVFPLGSENLLARRLGMRSDPQQVAQTILTNHQCLVDLGRINGRYFLLMASAGFDADIIERIHAGRTGHITKWDYLRVMGACAMSYAFPPFKIRIDDDPAEIAGHHAIVLNLPEYAFRPPICPDSRADDGLLDLFVFQRPGTYNHFMYALAIMAGRHRELDGVFYRRIQRAHIESVDPVPVQIDGDPSGRLPATIEVEAAALRLVVPPEYAEGDRGAKERISEAASLPQGSKESS